jgi:hypothetical protein
MTFESADPSVVRSIKQRDLLNAWLRAVGKLRTLPALTDYQPDRIADEQADMMSFDVVGEAHDARFLITHEGTRLTTTYGNDDVDPDKRTNRYLDDAIGPERYARVVAPYLTCLMRKRPTYSVSMVQDPDGKDVSYERLLLPFGSADAVGQIIGSYKSIRFLQIHQHRRPFQDRQPDGHQAQDHTRQRLQCGHRCRFRPWHGRTPNLRRCHRT